MLDPTKAGGLRLLIAGGNSEQVSVLAGALCGDQSGGAHHLPDGCRFQIQTVVLEQGTIPGAETCDLILLDITRAEIATIEKIQDLGKRMNAPVLVFLEETDRMLSLEIVRQGAVDCVIKRSGYLAALPFIVEKAYEMHAHNQRMRQLDLRLNATLKHLEENQEAIDEELRISRRIQAAMIPQNLPRIDGLEMASLYLPSGSIGGDLFDILILDSDRIAFLIFDVAGHGVPSALISAMAKISFANHLRSSGSLVETFDAVNREILENVPREYYITAFAAILDLNTYVLRYSNASHTTPFLFRGATGRVDILHTSGLFVGMLEIPQYEEKSTILQNGDRLFLCTDGLYEIFNAQRQMYGKARLKSFLLRNRACSAAEILETIIKEQGRFLGTEVRDDDVTALIVDIQAASRYDRLLEDLGFGKKAAAHIITFHHFEDAEERVSQICREMADHGFHESDIRKTRMLLFEALSNAFEHGNRGERGKRVFLGYSVDPDAIRVGVMDEGAGFNLSAVPDPLAPEHDNREGGRGLFLTRTYADQFSFNEKGNRIHIVKNKTGGAPA